MHEFFKAALEEARQAQSRGDEELLNKLEKGRLPRPEIRRAVNWHRWWALLVSVPAIILGGIRARDSLVKQARLVRGRAAAFHEGKWGGWLARYTALKSRPMRPSKGDAALDSAPDKAKRYIQLGALGRAGRAHGPGHLPIYHYNLRMVFQFDQPHFVET